MSRVLRWLAAQGAMVHQSHTPMDHSQPMPFMTVCTRSDDAKTDLKRKMEMQAVRVNNPLSTQAI
jgi:hypothetical protein